ncbi:MAG: hypothetical protein NC306_12610 [Butyrivibrio sp.]|nr:hypothetical protein [Butyrivibrio sp.]
MAHDGKHGEKNKKGLAFYRQFDGRYVNALQLTATILVGLAMSVIKFIFGLIIHSLVWVYSGFYALGLSGGKYFLFRGTRNADEKRKYHHILATAALLFIVGFIFDICIMIKQFSNDLAAHYPVPIVILASIYFVVSYGLAIRGILQTMKRREIEFYAYKVISISGALMNMVLLQRMILSCTGLPDQTVTAVNAVFGYFIGATLMLSSVFLFVRCLSAIKTDSPPR